MEERARAKVNLFLHVLGRRADGYHLLDSLAVFAGACDVLRAEPADALTLEVSGPFGGGLAVEDNLVLRAARAWVAAAGVPGGAAITLEKNLPVASGIGGGSADAAAALRLLPRLWGVALPGDRLAALAAGLGADVPVCLRSAPARMGGVGDLLRPAPAIPPGGMLLVNPGVAVSTPAVFGARRAVFMAEADLPAGWATAQAMAADLLRLENGLEEAALRLAPPIGAALTWLRRREGCLLARMSGSGATCFGLFGDGASAAAAAASVPAGWWAWGGEFAR